MHTSLANRSAMSLVRLTDGPPVASSARVTSSVELSAASASRLALTSCAKNERARARERDARAGPHTSSEPSRLAAPGRVARALRRHLRHLQSGAALALGLESSLELDDSRVRSRELVAAAHLSEQSATTQRRFAQVGFTRRGGPGGRDRRRAAARAQIAAP